jgi:hypothetical protein
MYGQPKNKARLKKLAQVCWDAPISAEHLDDLLQGKIEQVGMLSRKRLFQRVAESYSWYAILQLLTPSELVDMLQNDVIDGLRSNMLKEKYKYAQQRLQGTL